MKRSRSQRHLERVRGLPCVLCDMLGQTQRTHTAAHHIREGQGMAQRASDFLAVALCHDCHQGPLGIHGDRSLLAIAKATELSLLAATIEALS